MPQDHNAPAAKRDVIELREHVDHLGESLIELREHVDQLGETLVEKMRDMQTEVLRAFPNWARPVELKLRSLPAIEERLGLLEERISRIERGDKLHGPS